MDGVFFLGGGGVSVTLTGIDADLSFLGGDVAVDAILGHDGDFDAVAPLVNGEGDVSLFRVKLPSDGRSGNFDVDFQFLPGSVRHDQTLLILIIDSLPLFKVIALWNQTS